MGKAGRDRHAVREAILLAMACVITCVWAVSQIASVVFGREIDAGVHLVMLTVAGALFGGAAVASRKKENGNGA